MDGCSRGRWAARTAKNVLLLIGFVACLGGAVECAASAPEKPQAVPYVRPKPIWDRFRVLVWQYKTSAPTDWETYRRAGIWGFHIDRGASKEKYVRFARRQGMPYYVDHAADKGYLHLTDRTGRRDIMRKKTVLERPWSLADPKTIDVLKGHLQRNVAVTKDGPVLAYAFDDEISLGVFTSPAEVDASPRSVAAYRDWLRAEYGNVERLNRTWGTRLRSFEEAEPVSFEAVRRDHTEPPFARWNLARWMDWRSYMDTQFSGVLADLTRYTNRLDPSTPAGFVGGQQPAPYGGYDYAKLARSVQWVEAYDIGGTCEILRSLWAWPERRPYVQTWFSAGDAKRDAWFLWYYLLHGCRGVIAWPHREGKSWFHWGKEGRLAPFIAANAETIREVQGPVSEPILDPRTRFEADPIALYYSHPSVQATWAMDVVTHKGTWPNRSSSLDNANQSAGRNRVAWMKLLEDCGYQYDVVTAEQVAAGHLDGAGYRVLVLNRVAALSDAEAAAIRRFVERGGTIIADHLTGVLDEHGVGRPEGGALDDLFGIHRDESRGYLDGRHITEIDGERYRRPFLERLRYDGALRYRGIVIYERGTRAAGGRAGERVERADVVIARRAGRGRAVYLNLTNIAYLDAGKRMGEFGRTWRELLGGLLEAAGLEPRGRVLAGGPSTTPRADLNPSEAGEPVPMAELVYWRNGDRLILGLVKNPVRGASISGPGAVHDVTGEPIDVRIVLSRPLQRIRDLRTGEYVPDGRVIRTRWKPWEALVYEAAAP